MWDGGGNYYATVSLTKYMANICDTSGIIIPLDDGEFTEEESNIISKELEADDSPFYCTYQHAEDSSFIEFEGESRWNIKAEDWAEFSKKHSCKIRITGREDGVGFVQVVCVENGEISQDEEIGYKF